MFRFLRSTSDAESTHHPRRRLEVAIAVGLLTGLATWWTWGAFEPAPVVQDEYSYVLQSEIFAGGKWTAPPPPVASSFQQPHVLTSPRVASKYPPGHALALAVGALAGVPWLSTLLLSALSGALVFLLIEPVAGRYVALAGWLFWLSDPINLRFRPSYFSEVTTGLMWLVAWWVLRKWRDSGERKWLLALAVALGWNAITRPLSAVALAIPVAVFVLIRVIRENKWRDLGVAILVGTVCVAVLPLWSVQTTGAVTPSPLGLYRAQYLPFDKPGFGLDTTPPRLPLSAVNADVYAEFAPGHVQHTLAGLPRIALKRLATLASAEWGGWRVALVPLALLGAAFGGAELWFAGACAASLFVVYLFYAHWAGWTLYYFEALPVASFFVAAGLSACARSSVVRARLGRATRPLAIAIVCALGVLTFTNLSTWRRSHIADARYDTAFHDLVDRLPFNGSVIFVRYAPDLHPHTTVVANSASLATDRVWTVIDDPSRNMEVLRFAGGRAPLLFEERGSTLRVYQELLDSSAADRKPGMDPRLTGAGVRLSRGSPVSASRP